MASLKRLIPAALTLFFPLVSIPAASAADTIRINGTGSGLVLLKPLMAAHQKENGAVSFSVEKSLGSSASIKAVTKQALDLSISGRPLKPAEIAEGLVQQAEGVESREQAQYLAQRGCDELQGFYFHRPLSEERLLEVLREEREEGAAVHGDAGAARGAAAAAPHG